MTKWPARVKEFFTITPRQDGQAKFELPDFIGQLWEL